MDRALCFPLIMGIPVNIIIYMFNNKLETFAHVNIRESRNGNYGLRFLYKTFLKKYTYILCIKYVCKL